MDVKEIKKFGFYSLAAELQELPNSYTSYVNAPDGVTYFIKIPKGLQSGSAAGRMFSNTLQKLKSINNPFVGKIVDYGIEQGFFYLVMEDYSSYQTLTNLASNDPFTLSEALRLWYKCTMAMQSLSGSNIFHRDLHPDNILLSDNGFKIIDIGWAELEHAISKNEQQIIVAKEFAAPELIQQNESLNRRHSDIYSLAQIIVYLLLGHALFFEHRNNTRRLQLLKAKYLDEPQEEAAELLVDTIKKCLDPEPQKRFNDYVSLLDAVKKLIGSSAGIENGTALLFPLDDRADLTQLITNTSEGIYIELAKNADDKYPLRLATKDFYVDGAIEIPCVQTFAKKEKLKVLALPENTTAFIIGEYFHKSEFDVNHKRIHDRILKYGYFISGINLDNLYQVTDAEQKFINVVELNERLRIELKVDNLVPPLVKSQDTEFMKWDTLLKEEMAYIKENAFTIKYSEVKIEESKSEATFKLVNPVVQTVLDFISKTRKEDEITLVIPGSTKDRRGRDVSIGYADYYNKDIKELKLKNFSGDKNAIPFNGVLAEDIEKELIQYKRQRSAMTDFKKAEMVNPELRKYIFNAAQLPEAGLIQSGIEVISKTKDNKPVPFKDSQINAVEKSLFRAPYVLIQGPPGTGKTTVITEVIRQLVKRNPEVKILITSQTNLAVDNVLKKIAKDKNIRFIRLGAEDKISFQELRKESYDSKLKTWGDRARNKSQQHFTSNYKKTELNLVLQKIVDVYEANKHNWKEAKVKLTQVLSFGKHAYVGLATNLESKADFENGLKQFLPEQLSTYNQVKSIHNKWLQIISNINDKPAITQRMVNSVNVIAATCNHIAAGMYRNYKFTFDYMIMDEAAKATLPETLVPLNMAKNVILIGDHKQLPPLVLSTKSVKQKVEEKLKTQLDEANIDFNKMYLEEPTLFETMYENAPDDYRELLDTQFRMPLTLGNMVSKFVYKNKLKSEEGNCGAPHSIIPFEPIVLVDTSDSEKRFSKQNGHSHANAYNAKIIHDLLVYIDSFDEVKNYTVGVITGYSSQVNELERMLRGKKFKNIVVPEDFRNASEKELVVSTVDKFQGSEKDIIIFDVVKSEVNGTLGFLAMENRINVAFSRAQRLMICVGDAKFIKNTPSKTGKKVLLQEFTEFMLSNAQVLASEEIEKLKNNG